MEFMVAKHALSDSNVVIPHHVFFFKAVKVERAHNIDCIDVESNSNAHGLKKKKKRWALYTRECNGIGISFRLDLLISLDYRK